jgi:signal peptidase II
MGNYADRVIHGYVIDFVDWHWRHRPGLHWPTFNVADSAIVVGVLLLLVETLSARRLPAPRRSPRWGRPRTLLTPGPQA